MCNDRQIAEDNFNAGGGYDQFKSESPVGGSHRTTRSSAEENRFACLIGCFSMMVVPPVMVLFLWLGIQAVTWLNSFSDISQGVK